MASMARWAAMPVWPCLPSADHASLAGGQQRPCNRGKERANERESGSSTHSCGPVQAASPSGILGMQGEGRRAHGRHSCGSQLLNTLQSASHVLVNSGSAQQDQVPATGMRKVEGVGRVWRGRVTNVTSELSGHNPSRASSSYGVIQCCKRISLISLAVVL